MRVGVVNGNGYECDVCHTLLKPSEAIKINSKINVDSTGGSKVVDSIGVCEDCYKNHFKILCGRGPLRQTKKRESEYGNKRIQITRRKNYSCKV